MVVIHDLDEVAVIDAEYVVTTLHADLSADVLHSALTGADTHKLDDLASPDDNTDLNVSISAHGLCPKLPNDATLFLNGIGGWASAGGGANIDINYYTMTQSETKTFSGLGFLPKVVWILAAYPAGIGAYCMSQGFDDAVRHLSVCMPAHVTECWGNIAYSLVIYKDASNFFVGRVTELNSDGFKFQVIKVGNPDNTTFYYMAIG